MRTLQLALALSMLTALVPPAGAEDGAFADEAGDEWLYVAGGAGTPPPGLSCHSSAVDILAASRDDEATSVTMTATFADLADADTLRCDAVGGGIDPSTSGVTYGFQIYTYTDGLIGRSDGVASFVVLRSANGYDGCGGIPYVDPDLEDCIGTFDVSGDTISVSIPLDGVDLTDTYLYLHAQMVDDLNILGAVDVLDERDLS